MAICVVMERWPPHKQNCRTHRNSPAFGASHRLLRGFSLQIKKELNFNPAFGASHNTGCQGVYPREKFITMIVRKSVFNQLSCFFLIICSASKFEQSP